MKSKPEFETPFEDSLAEFEVSQLPAEWKAELIDNALSESARGKGSQFSSFGKFAFGGLAACWVAIAILHITTPRDSGLGDEAIARHSEIDSDDLPLLMAYFGRRHAVDTNL